MADPEAISIFGRASELAAIAWFLGAVLEGPAALVLQGEAGIGKTALWEESVAGAAGAPRAFAAAGDRAERSPAAAGAAGQRP